MDWNSNNIIKHHILYHKILYITVLVLAVFTKLFGYTEDTGRVIIFVSIVGTFFIVEILLQQLKYFDSEKIYSIYRYFEILVYNILQAFIPNNLIILAVLCIFTTLIGIEFALYGTDYDKSDVFIRKALLILALVCNAVVAFVNKSEAEWLCYFILQLFALCVIFFIVDWIVSQNEIYDRMKNRLIVEKNDIESTNEKLLEYQNRVKTINEQINYQKIDLARVIKELEQVNIEVKSQTEVMRYMASTFDVVKCIDVITDAIVDVKKTKLCALYVDKDVYMNKMPSFIVKTNYSSLERRLKKEIDQLYRDFIREHKTKSLIYTGEMLKELKFIGDVNINSVAILPLVDGTKEYGIMIVGSDKDNYFEKGLNYFESCIIEFNVAVKSANLYLKTQDMARKDGLTGIFNRLYFKELFAAATKKIMKQKQPISVALFDIDKFKNVNDTYGHLAGDEVIKMIARVSADFAEQYGGFACRYGGEEFLLVFPNYDEHQILPILEKMHETIKTTKVKYNELELSVNVCIGYSSYPGICDNVDLLVSRADKAMYYGKRNGRGRLVMDNPSIDLEE